MNKNNINTVTTVKNILDYINKIAPYDTQEDYDNSGFATGNLRKKVEKSVVCLDITQKIVEFAKENNADLIISHHPVIFSGLKQIHSDDVVYNLIKNDISSISAHTNFDKCDGGIDDILSNILGVNNIETLDGGIGKIGDNTSFEKADEFANFVKDKIKTSRLKYYPACKPIKKIATICGSGGSYINEALLSGADAIVTADLKHEHFVDAQNKNYTLIDAGHYETEYFGVIKLKEHLEKVFTQIEFLIMKDESFIQTL